MQLWWVGGWWNAGIYLVGRWIIVQWRRGRGRAQLGASAIAVHRTRFEMAWHFAETLLSCIVFFHAQVKYNDVGSVLHDNLDLEPSQGDLLRVASSANQQRSAVRQRRLRSGVLMMVRSIIIELLVAAAVAEMLPCPHYPSTATLMPPSWLDITCMFIPSSSSSSSSSSSPLFSYPTPHRVCMCVHCAVSYKDTTASSLTADDVRQPLPLPPPSQTTLPARKSCVRWLKKGNAPCATATATAKKCYATLALFIPLLLQLQLLRPNMDFLSFQLQKKEKRNGRDSNRKNQGNKPW